MRQFLIIIILFISTSSKAQTELSDSGKIVVFCKVWGLLKYHHPAVAKGKFDWDRVFLEKLKALEKLKTREAINDFYYDWILNLGNLNKESKRIPPSNSILSNYANEWIDDTTIFFNKVSELLHLVINNSRAKNHYVKRKFFGLASASFANEKIYKDSSYPSTDMRLLVLSRYWNIVNYFYPYKYLTDTNWQDILHMFVPKFILADNKKEYNLTLLKLFSKLNDSHTGFNYRLFESYFTPPPFNNKIIDNKIIVLEAFNDSLCKANDIRYGDVILTINGQNIKSYISQYSKYISASNYASLCAQLTPLIIWSEIKYPVTISCERNGDTLKRTVSGYPIALIHKDLQASNQRFLTKPQSDKYKILADSIAYLDLKALNSKKEVKKVMQDIKSTKAVIIDIRNYPNSSIFRTVTNFFCTDRKPFARFAKQSIKYPGVLVWVKTVYCGKKRGKKYNGKVVVLTNESTMSFAEYFTMALKTIPNVTLIGNHTAGADGSNYKLALPGNIQTSFSNEAVYFPNGDKTQRVGIVPDIIVVPTIEGIRLKKDEALDMAVKILTKE